MTPSTEDIAAAVERLRQTPEHFRLAAKGLSDAQLRRPPAPGAWSVHEVLAHIRGGADVQGRWIAGILEGAATIRYKSPRTGMAKTAYEEEEFATFLADFARQRAELIACLSSLDPEGWSRSASFTGKKPGWSQAVYDVAIGMVAHEQAHYAQVSEAAGRSG